MLEAAQTSTRIMFEDGKQWEGKTVNGIFPLRQYLGGSDRSAVYLTEIGGQNPRKAAIKLMEANIADADIQLARWRFASKLSHPHLLQIHEVGSCRLGDDELLFVVTEYADETLSQILPQRALTPEEARELLNPTLQALTYIHQNGFAHGHLKPSNLMVVGEQLKVSSDGLCRIGAPYVSGSKAGLYEPPEASGEGFIPSGDVWSLAVTLTEALTQRLPVWTDRLQGEPSIPTAMPKPFADIARHSLLRDPRSRWTVAAISARLAQPAAVPQQSVQKQKTTEANASASTGKPRPEISTWLYAGAMIAAIAIAMLLASWLRRGHTPPAIPAVAALTKSDKPSPRVGKLRHSPQSVRTSPNSSSSDQVVSQVVPEVPAKALHTIHGKIRITVRVHVDAAGNVARAELTSRGPSRYFADHAMEAAQAWKFAQGQTPSRAWLLQFVFERSGVTVQPRQIA
ncbi:MAG: serine/threonine protein kinase [Terriglobales bacterium]